MRKILLIGINARYSHPSVALYYLREAVGGLDCEIIIEEFTIRNNIHDIERCIAMNNPDVVGFSAYIWNSAIIHDILHSCRIPPDPVIVLGGPEVSYNPDEWLRTHANIRYIITGPGEEGFRRLVENRFNVPETIITSNNAHFSEISFPYRSDDFIRFINKNIYYESSRGCPFRCAYCISSCEDQKLEFRTLDSVERELACIMVHSPKLVKFIDRTFNAQPSRARHIWRMLIERYSTRETTFHFEMHPLLMTDEDFDLLRGARKGLFQFEIGIQSTHLDVLSEIGRNGNWEKEREIIMMLHEMGNIHLHVDLIAGLPWENIARLRESFNRVFALRCDHFQLGTLKLLPGTAIRKDAEKYGIVYSTQPPYEIIASTWLSREEIAAIKKIARLLDVLYNSHRFTTALSELTSRFETSWDMFHALANDIDAIYDASWETLYDAVLSFVRMRFPAEEAFFKDCLAYDWFKNFSTHRVPKRIKTFRARELKKEIAKNRNTDTRIFVPESSEFREKYLHGKEFLEM